MARYPLNLPAQLKEEAEKWAADQGVSLNQFIMWAVAEKVGALRQNLAEYDLTASQVHEALAFYDAHRAEIDAAIATEPERSQQDVLNSIRRRRFFRPPDVGAPDSTTLLREDRAR